MPEMTTQEEYSAEAAAHRRRGPTQAERILRRLAATPGKWVEMPELVRVSGAYAVHSRVAQLRGEGHLIDHRNQWRDGVCCSMYRLVPETSDPSQPTAA